MQEGMLWYDNENQKEMREKISNAVDFFQAKYGQLPDICYVHPEEFVSEIVIDEKIKIQPNERVIKHHIWLEFPEK